MCNTDNLPSVIIPCENLDALKALLELLYAGILTDEAIKFLNVPEGWIDTVVIKGE